MATCELFRAFERMLEGVQGAGIVADAYPIATRPASEIDSARSEDMSTVTGLWLGKLRIPDRFDSPHRGNTETAPPPPPTETVVVSPGPDYIWIDGEYEWNGFAWVWIGGHWGYPPHPHAIWISGRDWHDRYGWHHAHGYWR